MDNRYEFSNEALKAGEDALRMKEPDLFDYGQKPGWHFDLINKVASAVFHASDTNESKQHDSQ